MDNTAYTRGAIVLKNVRILASSAIHILRPEAHTKLVLRPPRNRDWKGRESYAL